MALPLNRPVHEVSITESTTSIATTPVAAAAVASNAGYIHRVMAGAGGATTGTIAVAVTINGGSDITGGGLTIAAGSGNNGSSVYTFPLTGANAVAVSEGDYVVFTPSGGTGASIPGAFTMVIRQLA